MKRADTVVGQRETLKMLKQDKVYRIKLANDTDQEIKDEILELCEEKNVPVQKIKTRRRLGQSSGIECPTSVVAYLKWDDEIRPPEEYVNSNSNQD